MVHSRRAKPEAPAKLLHELENLEGKAEARLRARCMNRHRFLLMWESTMRVCRRKLRRKERSDGAGELVFVFLVMMAM